MQSNDVISLCRDVFVKPFEGCAKILPDGRVKAYPDPGTGGKPWTIGYGSTGPDIGPDTIWTIDQCEKALEHHLVYFYVRTMELCPGLKGQPTARIAAVVSWAYNCGLGNLRISTFRKRINEQDWEQAADECLKWNKAAGRVLRGLTRRRQAEAMFIRNPYAAEKR